MKKIKKKILAPQVMAVIGGIMGLLLAVFGGWEYIEPMTGIATLAVALAVWVRARKLEKKLGAYNIEQKEFEITFGLREGLQGDGRLFTPEEAACFIQEWMAGRLERGLPFVTGKLDDVKIIYPSRKDDGKLSPNSEPSITFSGILNPVYDKGRIDEEVVETLTDLATFIQEKMGGNKRMFLSYLKKSWVVAEKTHGSLLGYLATGEPVYDAIPSHIVDHEGASELIAEALLQITPRENEEVVLREVDFGKIIGKSLCVPTTDADEIVFAKRPKRAGLMRFVKGREPEPSTVLSVVLVRGVEGILTCMTAYVGLLSPMEPTDYEVGSDEREKSIAFWSTHALVWGEMETEEGTETTQCPW